MSSHTCISYGRRGTSSNKVDLPPLAILKNMHSFVSQITWWVPHVFVWRSPKRSKMSSHRIYVPHTKYIHVDLHMAGAGWVRGPPGRRRARPASILNMPPRAPPAGVCAAGGARRSRTSLAGPGGVPYILYGSPNERPQFGPPPEPQIRQDLYGEHNREHQSISKGKLNGVRGTELPNAAKRRSSRL